MITSLLLLAWDNTRTWVERSMVRDQPLKHLALAALMVLGGLPISGIAAEPATCGVASETCLASCKRFDARDPKLLACNNFCRKQSPPCVEVTKTPVVESLPPVSTPEPAVESPPPTPDSVPTPPDALNNSEPQVSTPPNNDVAPSPVQVPIPTDAPTPLNVPATPTDPTPEPELKSAKRQPPKVEPLPSKNAVVKEQERNTEMITAIRAGNLKVIRRLIEVQGLHPTYVFTHEFNPTTREYDGRVSRLRLSDVFSDTSTLRNDKTGLNDVLSLFLELGMDVKATLPSAASATELANGSSPQVERTAWGPSLRFMETSRDRAARLQAFETALQAGLVPNEEIRDWLFTEITQVCGRDRSKFAIQLVDLLIKYLGPAMGPSLQESFWRFGERGPETVSDVLDRSFAPPQPKNYIEKAEFALKDDMWEQCAPLSRRINRFLTQGN